MRNELIRGSVTAFVAVMLLFGGYAIAADEAVDAAAPAATAEEIINPICPVMHGKVNPDLFVEYKGKKVYFCCPGCIDEFNAKPEKYIASLPQFAAASMATDAYEGHETNNLSKLIVPAGIAVFAVLAFFAFKGGSKKPETKS